MEMLIFSHKARLIIRIINGTYSSRRIRALFADRSGFDHLEWWQLIPVTVRQARSACDLVVRRNRSGANRVNGYDGGESGEKIGRVMLLPLKNWFQWSLNRAWESKSWSYLSLSSEGWGWLGTDGPIVRVRLSLVQVWLILGKHWNLLLRHTDRSRAKGGKLLGHLLWGSNW